MKNLNHLYCVLEFLEELGELIKTLPDTQLTLYNKRIDNSNNFKLYAKSSGSSSEKIENILSPDHQIFKIINNVNEVLKDKHYKNLLRFDPCSNAYCALEYIVTVGIDMKTFNADLPNILTNENLNDIYVDRRRYLLESSISNRYTKPSIVKNKI